MNKRAAFEEQFPEISLWLIFLIIAAIAIAVVIIKKIFFS